MPRTPARTTQSNGAENQDCGEERVMLGKSLHKAEPPAQMNHAGLHPAFLPADALEEPVPEFMGSLLRRIRIQASDPVTSAGQPDSEVGVLCDVPLVPAARPPKGRRAKMVRCAAQRDRHFKRAKAWIDEIEQCGVLDSEKLRQPRILVISDGQTRLKAVEAAIRGEPRCGEPELVRRRRVPRRRR